MKKKLLLIIPIDLYNRLRKKAKETDRSVNSMIREIIKEYLNT